jgi:hypothetical protein
MVDCDWGLDSGVLASAMPEELNDVFSPQKRPKNAKRRPGAAFRSPPFQREHVVEERLRNNACALQPQEERLWDDGFLQPYAAATAARRKVEMVPKEGQSGHASWRMSLVQVKNTCISLSLSAFSHQHFVQDDDRSMVEENFSAFSDFDSLDELSSVENDLSSVDNLVDDGDILAELATGWSEKMQVLQVEQISHTPKPRSRQRIISPPTAPSPVGGARARTEKTGLKACACKKSKCLKLYCDCFKDGEFCGSSCKCEGCINTEQHEEAWPENVTGKVGKMRAKKQPVVCGCTKTACLKKYCVCFASGKICGSECKCEGCMNSFESKPKAMQARSSGVKQLIREGAKATSV